MGEEAPGLHAHSSQCLRSTLTPHFLRIEQQSLIRYYGRLKSFNISPHGINLFR